jgi:eukaryotic-like serine/threonine-protein kinase
MAIRLIHDRMGTAGDPVSNQDRARNGQASCPEPMCLDKLAEASGNSSESCMDDQSSLISQAYDDYFRRKSRGDQVDIDAFCAEFGEIGSALKQRIEVHDLLLQHTSLIRECIEVVWPKPGDELRRLSLVAELGRGSFSRVFLARNKPLGGRLVVVKVHRGSSREAENLGKLVHDNIVPITFAEHASDDGFSLLHMPFLGRATLSYVLRRLWRDGHLPRRASEILAAIRELHETTDTEDELPPDPQWFKASYLDGILAIALQIVEGVAHAHRMSILHLDLKPSNVLMTESGCPRVLDFNLSVDRESQHMRLGGTPPYMSPEQATCFLMGEQAAVVDERSDVYALGVMLHEMLCGKRPFECAEGGRLTTAVLRKQLAVQRAATVDVSWAKYGVNDRLASIVKRCLAADPDDRFPSTAKLVWALRREVSMAGRIRRWAGTHRPVVLGAAALLLSVGLGVSNYVATLDSVAVRQYRKAIACQEAGDFPQAIVHLTNCLQTAPDQPHVLFQRAQAYVEMKDFTNAIADLKVVAEQSKSGETYALLGYCYNRAPNHDEAVSRYGIAIQSGYSPAWLYYNLGCSHYQLGSLSTALSAFDRAIELDPNQVDYYYRRAVVHLGLSEANEVPWNAIHDIQAAHALGDCSPEISALSAVAYARAAAFDNSFRTQAVESLMEAIRNGVALESIQADKHVAAVVSQLSPSELASSTEKPLNRKVKRGAFVNPFSLLSKASK